MVEESEIVTPQLETEVVTSFKYLGSGFINDQSPQDDVKIWSDKWLETLRASKQMCNVKSLKLDVDKEVNEKVGPHGKVWSKKPKKEGARF